MPPTRPLVAVLSAGALLLALSACERPTPGVTIVSDGKSARTGSALYCRSVADLDAQRCVETPDEVAVLRVAQGGQIGIDVDKKLADKGWYVVDADAKQRSAVQDEHYFTIQADFTDRPVDSVINLEIRSLDRVAEDGARVLGVWRFQILQK